MAPPKTPGKAPDFLQQLSTLRSFLDAMGMGMTHSESEVTSALRGSGYNVEMALERLLSGGDASSSGMSGAGVSTSSKKRAGSNNTHAKTPAKRIKSSNTPKTSHATPTKAAGAVTTRLLLCKRWTVGCSKSIRGRIGYGEKLSFDENYKHVSIMNHTPAGKKQPKMDPIVRFRGNNVEGSLNRYLCEVLGPLLRLPATNTSHNNAAHAPGNSQQFVPMIHLAAEALMEDHFLKIGSDIPINLQIYINDPIGFFALFQAASSGGKSESDQFFGRKKTKVKARGSYSKEEVVEAAFRLLQWAERGEELDFGMNEDDAKGGEKEVHIDLSEKEEKMNAKSEEEDASSTSSGTKDLSLNGDGDYEEEPLESDEVNELNQLVVEDGKLDASKAIPELTDPLGLKSGVVLRPYQRQALYWMCRREGLPLKELGEPNASNADEELELLVELASSTYSTRGAANDVQVWGVSGISCDCGPVVVGDEAVASGATPVIDYGKNVEKKQNYVHHPLWKRRFLATEDMSTVYAFYVNELLGVAAASTPNPPRQCVGGILADAMGLGKTVMLMSLILKSKEAEDCLKSSVRGSLCASVLNSSGTGTDVEIVDISSDDEDTKDEDYEDKQDSLPKSISGVTSNTFGTTLVIAPLSLISQWEEELASKTNLTALVYYDNTSKKLARREAFSSVDVVITTYGTIQSEYVSIARASKNGGSNEASQPLLSFGWKRIILDEAHGIKNPSTVVSKACCMLKADSRWCVTGTPIQNSLQDVYGLLKFLRHEPWCESSFWKNAITTAISCASTGTIVNDGQVDQASPMKGACSDGMSVAFGRVRRVLAPIILRRTKDTLSEDGTPILTLPPIESSIVHVTLSPAEREFYNALLHKSQSVFEGFVKAGTASKSWFAIFSLLQRLRQSCDHVSLTVQNRFDTSEMGDDVGDTKDQANGKLAASSCDSVSEKFLTDLLNKFKRNTVGIQEESTAFVKEVAQGLSQVVGSSEDCLKTECPICFEEPNITEAVHTPCAHMFCKKCLLDEFHEQQIRGKKQGPCKAKVEGGDCPVCHAYVKISRVILIKRSNDEMVPTYLSEEPCGKENVPLTHAQQRDEAARVALESALANGASSAKLEAVLMELDAVWEANPGSKILIFSQFLGFLDIVTRALNQRGITSFRIDGKTTLKERVKMIDKFNKDKPSQSSSVEEGKCLRGSVFLVSMKAGGCGLNLVAASTVFIIDPWWNMAVEDQCINRIHRIGQRAELVRVRKFVVTDSVEEKIVKLQLKKKGMANDILDDVNGDGQFENTKPTLEDFKLIFG